MRREYGEQLGETGFVGVARGDFPLASIQSGCCPSQGFANLRAKFGVGVDLVAHGCDTLNGWLSSGRRFDVDFWESLVERGFMPVLGMGLDDVRVNRRPGRVEAQAP